ncbi:HNH endonuclease [Massilia sp. LjRoot122]|uniref:HNH endonuclease n=1 Tax=Massilia sp. LjRoot122 TaxID=3342257 RepID=UPI003ED054B3
MSQKTLVHLRQQACKRQRGRCYYCELPLHSGNAASSRELALCRLLQCTAEHLLPRQDGGRDTAENIVAACLYCNRRRHNRPVDRVLPPAEFQSYVAKRMARGKWHPAICSETGRQLIALLTRQKCRASATPESSMS